MVVGGSVVEDWEVMGGGDVSNEILMGQFSEFQSKGGKPRPDFVTESELPAS